MKLLSKCAVCSSPLVDVINRKMTEGMPDVKISDWLKAENSYISRITLGNHKRQHLTDQHMNVRKEVARKVQQAVKIESTSSDLAKLVSGYVFKMVENGDLMPTLSEGLRAQEMLDRRTEKNADRGLAVAMAGILGGGSYTLIAEEAEDEQGT